MKETRKTHAFVAMGLLFISFADSVYAEEESSKHTPRVDWIREHAMRFRSIDPNDENFTDFEPLAEILSDVRIVQLGEMGHGDGATFHAKTRLIKFLHQELGFDVLAFESGLYHCRKAWELLRSGMEPYDAFRAGVFGVWSGSEQLRPLIEYWGRVAKSDRPLELCGFDCQFTGSVVILIDDINELWEALGTAAPDASQRRAIVETLNKLAYSWRYEPTLEKRRQCHNALIVWREALNAARPSDALTETELAFWRQFVDSTTALAAYRGWTLDELESEKRETIRDPQMARNLIWLAREVYPQRKMIVWASSPHLTHNRPSDWDTAMGHEVFKVLGKETYTVGFIAGEGDWGLWTTREEAKELEPPASGSLEDFFMRAGCESAFLDFRSLGADGAWLKEKLPARPFGLYNWEFNWTDMFDGIVFIREMYANTARKRDFTQEKTTEPSHELAITNLSGRSHCVQGATVSVIVTVKNQGNTNETFDLTLTDSTEGKIIANKSITLSASGHGMDETVDRIWTGQNPGDLFGSAPSCGEGDVNGDSYNDILISANEYPNHERRGRVYLYYGGTHISTTPDLIFDGESGGDQFGYIDTALGDVNHDTYADIVVGALGHNSRRGRVYLYYGGPSLSSASADLVFDGPSADGLFSNVALGDVNHDHCDDLIVGAPLHDSQKGKVYLYYGAPARDMDTICDKSFDTGTAAIQRFGDRQIAVGGDVNGDQYGDLIVTSWKWPDGKAKGRAYLFYGGKGTSMDEDWNKIFTGEENGDCFGYGAELGDVNADGYADVIIAAYRYDSKRGRVYIYYGGPDMDTEPDLILTGEDNIPEFGHALALGDVNNDNYEDILIGASNWSNGDCTGRAYLYYGGDPMDNICDITFTGPDGPGVSFGVNLDMGDINGDGYDDALIGGHRYPSFSYQGRAYLYFGGPGGSTKVSFDWNTTNASIGHHALQAESIPVEGEENTANNTKTITIDVEEPPK